MNAEDIRKLVMIACDLNLLELEVEGEGFRVRIKRSPTPSPPVHREDKAEAEIHYIKAPLVGTFRISRSPGEPPLVSVGSDVRDGQVVCYIEAMRIPNEVISDRKGKVLQILLEDGTPVQYGQPLIALEVERE
jgi:biotin carboxyl carrier protein